MGKRAIFLLCTISSVILINTQIEARRRQKYNEYLIEDQRTHTRRENYILEKALQEDLKHSSDRADQQVSVNNEKLGIITSYMDEGQPDTIEEEPALTVDSDMIRNDIILLDNSVETRTRKRGNFKVKKYHSSDINCSCVKNKSTLDLGESSYPRFLETKVCSQELCSAHYKCEEDVYDVAILKKKTFINETSDFKMPPHFSKLWVFRKQRIVIGCVCTDTYFAT